MRSSYILSLALCLAASALSHTLPTRNSPALPPSQDPWYTAPEDLLSYPAGSIIRVRPDPLAIYAAIGKNLTSASYNILYRTTDSNDLPTFAVTTLLTPVLKSSSGKKSQGLVSYQIPYNSPSVDASPSWTLSTGLNWTFPDITAALQQGWYVSVTDFEGPNATFGVGAAEGHAVLDGLRAVTKSSSSPLLPLGLKHGKSAFGATPAAQLRVNSPPSFAPRTHPRWRLRASPLAVYQPQLLRYRKSSTKPLLQD